MSQCRWTAMLTFAGCVLALWLGISAAQAQVGPNAPAVFNFSDDNYRVTENESLPGPFGNIPNAWPSDTRSIRGALITVTRTNGLAGRVMVDYNTVAGTAGEVTNYIATTGTLVFDDFQTSTNFIVPIRSDGASNLTVSFQVVLSNPRKHPSEAPALPDPLLGDLSTAEVQVVEVNENFDEVSIERATYRVDEYGNRQAIVDVICPRNPAQGATRAGGSVLIRTVDTYTRFVPLTGSDYTDAAQRSFANTPYTDGTAPIVNVQDYTPNEIRLSFPPDVNRQRFAIVPIDDAEVEFNEDIMVEIVNAEGVRLGANRVAHVTILHHEQPAGAADRDWNPADVSFTLPPFNSTPGANGPVYAVAIQPDQKAIIGGDFTGYNAEFRNRIARLNPNGSLDTTFNPELGADGFISDISLYGSTGPNTNNNGKIVIVGAFTSYNGIIRYGIARLNTDGSLDTTFNPGDGADGVVRSVVVLSTGKILIGGEFTLFNGVERNGIARLNDNGTLDVSFDPGTGADGPVWAVEVDDSAKAIQLGQSQFGVGPAEYRTNIDTGARSGTITVSFAPDCVPDTLRVYYGAALIFDSGPTNEYGGATFCSFANYTGPITYVIPYGPGSATDVTIVINEGSGDPGTVWAFNATIENEVAGQRVLVGGEFQNINGIPRNGIARLKANGALDTTFDPGGGADGPVYAIASQNDFKVLIGGAFHDVDFRARNGLARLNEDGSLDTSYEVGEGTDNSVYAIELDPTTGKAVIGGIFRNFDRVRRMGLARIMTNGVLDTSFMDTAYNQFAGLPKLYSFDPPNPVNALALQSNGDIIIGGSFTNIGGHNHMNIADLPSPLVVWTRQQKVTRYNVARVLGGYTQGPGTISFSYPSYAVDEFSPDLSVTLNRVDGRLGSVGANFSTADRLASGTTDYSQSASSLLWREAFYIAPNSVGYVGNSYFVIPISDDTLIEGDEIFDMLLDQHFGSINLSGDPIPMGGARGRFNAPVEIRDNDVNRGTFNFSAPTYTVNENQSAATITLIRTNGNVGQVSVDFYTLQEGDPFATAFVDYTPVIQTVTFPSGVTNQTITIPILHDTDAEPDQAITLILTNASSGAFLPGGRPDSFATATVTIVDNDYAPGRLSFSSATYITNENASYARVQVTRTGGSVGSTSVQFATRNGTGTNKVDYTGSTNTLSWSSGDSAPKTILIPLLRDNLVDGEKTINLVLMNPNPSGALGTITNAVVKLTDDDFYGQLAFGQSTYYTSENGTNLSIIVLRTNGVAGFVSVSYTITAGTATAGLDYRAPASGTLSFVPGQISATIIITNVNDSLPPEGEEDFRLALVNPQFATLGQPDNATVIIVDDESSNVPAGSLDTTFESAVGANNPVYALALQPNTNLLVGGDFTRFNQVTRQRLTRLLPDGTLDPNFNVGQGPNRPIRAMALQPDGKILIGGFFTRVHGTNRNHIARLNTDGTLDQFFNPGGAADNPVYGIALLPDGKVVLGGAFTRINNISRPGVAILNTNGTIFTGFNPGLGANGVVYGVAVQQDGKILIVGDFTTVGNVPRAGIARLNADGTLDTLFNTNSAINGPVRAVAVQPDGRILVGGSFTTINGVGRGYLARLNTDGTLDQSFLAGVAGANGSVFAITLQADDKILVGGDFTLFNGVTRGRITRLNLDGRTDPTINFGTGANAFVNSIVVQPDRKIVIGGGFTVVDGFERNHVARLHGGSLAGAGAVEFEIAAYTGSESEKEASILVRRIGGTTGNITVQYATTNGTAKAGVDYTNVTGTLTFVEGEVLRTFVVPIIDDKEIEDPESLELGLFNVTGGGALGFDPTATLTIVSDDSLVSFLTETYNVNENAVSGNASIAVMRTGATNTSVTLDYRTGSAGTATPGLDYAPVSDSITFLPGETLKFFPIRIVNDTNVEGQETINLFLTNVTANATLGLASSLLSIVDDDFAPGVLNLSSATYTVNEYETNVVITVVRTNGSSGVVSVNFATSDGTATAGQDYLSTIGTLAFGDGETIKTFHVPIVPDYMAEMNETVVLALSNPVGGASLGLVDVATLTILNNNLVNGVLSFSQTNYSISESQLLATITVERGFGFSNAVSVQALTVAGTAQNGTDFVNQTNTLVWGANDAAPKTFTVQLVNDTTVEESETLTLILTNVTGGAVVGNVPVAALTIQDDDFGPGIVGFTSASYSVSENGGSAVITVSRTFGKSGEVRVDFATVSGGNAVPGQHYLPASGTLVFADGETNKSFTVPILDNSVVEVDHTIQLELSNVVGASFSNQLTSAVLTILENEQQAGSIDTSFSNTGANAPVHIVTVQTNNGKIIAGGDFTTFNGLTRSRLVRVNPNGGVDTGFDPVGALNNSVRALTLQGEGKLVVGGSFTAGSVLSNSFLTRLQADGTPDTNFMAGVSGVDNFVYASAVGNDGRLVVAGLFTSVHGVQRHYVARLDANGYLDTNFDPGLGANDAIRTVAVLGDGKVLVGGDFTSFNGTPRGRLARLNVDGSLDTTFLDTAVGADHSVRTLAVQSDGKILVGGTFTNFNGVLKNRIARLNSNGSLDSSFNTGTGFNEFVSAIALQSNGKLVVGGGFTTFNGTPANRIVRLLETGAADTSINFGTGANNFINTIAIQPDNKILIGGGFTQFDGVARNYIARLNGGENVGTGTLIFSAADYPVLENASNIVITVRRSIGSTDTVSVNFTTYDLSAVDGVNYVGTNGTLTFGPGETIKTFTVRIIDDLVSNSNRVFGLRLSNPINAILGSVRESTVTILNNDNVISLSLSTYTVSEGAGLVQITVDRSGGSVGTVSVDFSTTPATALAGIDFLGTNGTLVFTNGQTSLSFTVPIVQDTLVEGNEVFEVSLARNVNTGSAILGQASAGVTIVDDDFDAGLMGFSLANFTVTEQGTFAVVTVIRTAGNSGAASVEYTTADGTATAGLDYEAVAGQLVFADGEISKTFIVPINDDELAEGSETIGLTLFNPTGVVLGQNTATLTILGDEATFNFSQAAYTVNEDAGNVELTVTRTLQGSGPISVSFFTSNNLAVAGLDYVATSGTLVFAPGEISKTLTVPILNDTLGESLEDFFVVLGNTTGESAVGPTNAAAVHILDNDISFSFEVGAYVVDEGAGTAYVNVVRTGIPTGTAGVTFQTSDGTATAGQDYVFTSVNLVYLPGETNKQVAIPILEDVLGEGDETVVLNLVNPTNATVGLQPIGELTILENEDNLRLSVSDFIVEENMTNAVISVVRRGAPGSNQVTVSYSTSSGTATPNADYTNVNGILVFSPLDTIKTFTVPIVNDSLAEGPETVLLRLFNITGGAVLSRPTNSTLTIVDDDVSFRFAAVNYTVFENQTNASIEIIRQGGTSNTVSVVFHTTPGNAQAGIDYENITNQVDFLPGVTNRIVNLPLVNDLTIEGNETVNLFLSNPTPTNSASLATPSTATLTILDDDSSVIVPAGSAILTESYTPANGVLEGGETVTVNFALRNVGNVDTANLVATLLSTNGVQPQGQASQTYGVLNAGGNVVSRPFTFRATGTNGSTAMATFRLTDGANNLGLLSFTYTLGSASYTFYNTAGITVNDNAPASPYPSIITVSNVAGIVTKVTVTLYNLTHSYPQDLDIMVQGPANESAILMSDVGGAGAVNNVTLTFDDDSANLLAPDKALTSGTYKTINYLAADSWVPPAPAGPTIPRILVFNPTNNPNGSWKLFVVDDSPRDVGNIAGGWSITVTTSGTIPATADLSVTANDTQDPVIAGKEVEYVIGVTNHGPATAIGVTLTNVLPPTAQFISCSVGSTHNNGTVIAQLGDLASGTGRSVVIRARAPLSPPTLPFSLINMVYVGAATTDVNGANNSASIKTTIQGMPSMSAAVKPGSPNDLVISWPAAAASYYLEYTDTLAPANWQRYTNSQPVSSGGLRSITINGATGGTRFFRLRDGQ